MHAARDTEAPLGEGPHLPARVRSGWASSRQAQMCERVESLWPRTNWSKERAQRRGLEGHTGQGQQMAWLPWASCRQGGKPGSRTARARPRLGGWLRAPWDGGLDSPMSLE